jgi:hypothetical protein
MGQADRITPETRGKKKQFLLCLSPIVEEKDGEMSMDLDNYDPQEYNSPDRLTPKQTSFMQMDQDNENEGRDDDEMVQVQEDSSVLLSKKDKGKEQAKPHESVEHKAVEEDVVQGTANVRVEESDDEGTTLPSKQPQMEQQFIKQSGRPKKAEIANKEWHSG